MAMTPEKRAKMEDLIYKFFTAFDKSGTNTNYYKEFFGVMTDKQFEDYFNEFFKKCILCGNSQIAGLCLLGIF